jgi:hypothetical protein
MPITDFSPDAIEEAKLARQQQMADLLRQQSMTQDQGRMVGNYYVAPSWTQNLNKVAQSLVGNQMQEGVYTKQKALADAIRQRNQGDMNAFMDASKTTPAITLPEDQQGPTAPAQGPNPQEQMRIALNSQNPNLQGIGQALMKQQFIPDNVVVGRSLLNRNNGQQVGQDATWAQEQEQARQQRIAEAQRAQEAKIEEARRVQQATFDNQRAMATLVQGNQAPHPITVVDEATGKNVVKDARTGRVLGLAPSNTGNKPLPSTALKMQQDAIDMVNTSGSINADLAGFQKQIESGKLDLGPVSNLLNAGRNAVGQSSEQSRNLASFKANLERLRNESLRLNKGVQTDGDAQRAWNELIQNINDPQVVSQRLAEIQQINKRGIELQKLNVDNIRSNYGHDPYDFSATQQQPSPYNKGGGTDIHSQADAILRGGK